MTAEERETISKAIGKYCVHCHSIYRVDSYTLKHLFERLTSIYIPHVVFKDIMDEMGFEHTKTRLETDSFHYRLKVINAPEIPPIYRGRGWEQWRYENG